ncbi:MAG: hypothetical protein MR025_06430 [Helicobacter trogontum]|uniref:hypothetical protein n=1 Tax=Helicobacter trogontum TaxID=50960 RepID=UPI00242E0D58|nr:hypothetical protein [Helicobacter trogontum]MCI5787066.1 hypothetical protein [Helicobacter trogontum]
MQKIICILCVLHGLLFANTINTNRIKQGDFTQLQTYLKHLDSISKQRELNYKEYKNLTQFACINGENKIYNSNDNKESISLYSSKLAPFLVKEFGNLFAKYAIPLCHDNGLHDEQYELYKAMLFWFNDANTRDLRQVFTTQNTYESFLFFKHNAIFATKINKKDSKEKYCYYGDGGGGECKFIFKEPIKTKGILTFNADFSLPPNEVHACDNFAYFSTFVTKDSRLEFINGGNIILDKPRYYDMFVSLLPKWYKEGLGGSVSYEVEVEIIGVMPWSFSACASGKDIAITSIKVLKMLKDSPNQKQDYIKQINKELNMYKLTISSTNKYINLYEKPNGRIIKQIPTTKGSNKNDETLLLNLNMSLWEVQGVSEWQRQLGYSLITDFTYEEIMGREWIKVLYFPPNAQKLTQAQIGYIHHSQLIVSDLP